MSDIIVGLTTIIELASKEWSRAAEWSRDLRFDLRLTRHQREYLASKILLVCRGECVRQIAKVFGVSFEEASRRLTQVGDPFRI